MFFLSDTDSDSDYEESKRNLLVERRLLRHKSRIFDLPDEKFQSYFQLNKTSFRYVLDTIEPNLKKGIRSTFIPNTIKLAATLRFLAHGSYQLSVGNDFNLGLSQPVVSKILSDTLDAMESKLCPLWIKFDMTEDEKNETKLNFFEKTEFSDVIGCVAGTHIKILAPKKEEQHLYFNRKGYYSINAMIICDHKMRIRFLDARHPGSTHDSLIWNKSHAKQVLQKRYDANDRNSWLLGDAGYPLEPYLITPYRLAGEGSAEAVFNLKHTKASNIGKRTIGILKNRFRCLLGSLHYKPAKAIKIANVCAALHNICIEYGLEITYEDEENDPNEIDEHDDAEALECAEGFQIRERIKRSLR